MDALSALKMVGLPNTASPLSGAALGGGANSISPADLAQLSSILQGGTTGAAGISPAQMSQMASMFQGAGSGSAAAQISPAEFPQSTPGLEVTTPGAASATDSSSFQNMLGGLVQDVADKQASANQAVTSCW